MRLVALYKRMPLPFQVLVVSGNWSQEKAEALCRKVMVSDADLALKACFNVTQAFNEILTPEHHYSSSNELEDCVTDILVRWLVWVSLSTNAFA